MAPSDTSTAPQKLLALFVSDVHLQESMPGTTAAFLNFLQSHAIRAQQLYVLGDLFEYWAGDDDLNTPFHRSVVDALRVVSDAGTMIFWIAGNRDFLISKEFADAAGATILQDGSVIELAGRAIVLAHGDAQCTDDVDYIAFRQQVRQAGWQQKFLAQPLAQRKAIIDGMRKQSRAAQRSKAQQIMDVNPIAIDRLFAESGTRCMIHGHTHRPAVHVTGHDEQEQLRMVLQDWDCDGDDAGSRRGGWIGIAFDGTVSRFDYDGVVLNQRAATTRA